MNWLFVLLLLLPGLATAQKWDPESGDPPPPTSWEPLPPPVLDIEPFRLLVFDECEPDRAGVLRNSGRLSVSILSEYPSIRFIPFETDSSLTLKLMTRSRGENNSLFRIPQHSFVLRVVLGADTAVFWVDRSGPLVSVECRRSSPLLVLEPIRSLDTGIVPMQFMGGSTPKDVRDFVAALKTEFGSRGDVIGVVQLDAGYYPCLAISEVEPAVVRRRGRTLAINKTPAGYLVCAHVSDSTLYSAVARWASLRQLDEIRRFANETR